MNRREDFLYSEIIKKIHSTQQVQPLYKNTKLLMVCLFFVFGVVLGYFYKSTKVDNQTSNLYVVFYSPFYNTVGNKGETYGNK